MQFGNPHLGELGIVIPAFNAELFLEKTLQAILLKVPAEKIIIIDDGSTDQTLLKAQKLGVHTLRHNSNQGKGTALMTGFAYAQALGWSWAITMDADGQHDPDDLNAFLDMVPGDKTALVVGRRKIHKSSMPLHRRFSNATTTGIISKLARQDVYDAQCGFRMYKLSAVTSSHFPKEGRFEFESKVLVLLCRKGFLLEPLDIATVYTDNGSHMRLVRDTLRFLKMVWSLFWMR